ncbi:MAG: V-type ATP synthase subunit D [Thermoplasmata archaeon]
MSLKTVKPTRSVLLEIKKKIILSQRGHKLLKMKRDGLILEFFNILTKARDIHTQLIADYVNADKKLSIAVATEGAIAVKSAAFAVTSNPEVLVRTKNVMGVVVPKIEASKVKKKMYERGLGIIGTSPRIEEAAKAFEDLTEKIIVAAEIETTMKKLLDEIEKTKRRVNALEFKVIPELTQTAAFIRFRLEEMERENIFRLKKIKG